MERPVLVTGGAGYIGSHAVLALSDAGHEVVVLDDLSNGSKDAVPANIPLEVANVGDRGRVAEILRYYGIKDIMHFAGSVRVEESVAKPLWYYANNTAASRTLIEAAIEQGVERFIFSSTAATYGVPDHAQVTERSPTAPINPYGWSKLMTEQMLRDAVAASSGFKVAILRYFNVAGADPAGRTGQRTENATHLIKVACELAVEKRASMQIFGTDYDTPDGTCVRDFIHVTDLAQAHLDVLDWLERQGPLAVFNCGYGRGFSVREVLTTVERLTGKALTVSEVERRPGDPPALIADATKLRRTVGWRPHLDGLEHILQTALDWERALLDAHAD